MGIGRLLNKLAVFYNSGRIFGYVTVFKQTIKQVTSGMHENLRIFVAISYCTAALLFIFGSYQYFPSIEDAVLGGWLFTIGSCVFVIADCLWIFRKRPEIEQRLSIRESLAELIVKPSPEDTRVNDCCAFFVSLGLLVGSVLFIPTFGQFLIGTWIFIVTNIVYISAQSYKIYAFYELHRRSKTVPQEVNADPLRFYIDIGFLIAALIYEVGTIFFLPSVYDANDMDFVAALMFVIGSIAELFAAVVLVFRALKMKKGDKLSNQEVAAELSGKGSKLSSSLTA